MNNGQITGELSLGSRLTCLFLTEIKDIFDAMILDRSPWLNFTVTIVTMRTAEGHENHFTKQRYFGE